MEANQSGAASCIVCGFPGAGKSIAAQRLNNKFGYRHIEASDFLRSTYYETVGLGSYRGIGEFAEKALAENPHVVSAVVARQLEAENAWPVVISGLRTASELALVRRCGTRNRQKFQTFFVEADSETRFRRIEAQRERGEERTWQGFRKRDERERRMGLDEMRDLCEIVQNRASLEEYFEIVDGWVPSGRLEGPSVTYRLEALRATAEGLPLEDRVLLALLNARINFGATRHFTGTEVEKLARDVFPKAEWEAQKRVEGYMSRGFYPEYELARVNKTGALRYRLSNTGVGSAIRRLRELTCERVAEDDC